MIFITYYFHSLFRFGGDPWQDCPDTETKGLNTCFIPRQYNRGYTQKIRVTATNPLGTAKTETTFNPDLESKSQRGVSLSPCRSLLVLFLETQYYQGRNIFHKKVFCCCCLFFVAVVFKYGIKNF